MGDAPVQRASAAEVPSPRGGIVFPQIARLELDELLTQLIDRAQDVLASQGRLRALLSANAAIGSDLSLPLVLRQIVESACALVGADYGALGVVGPDGRLEQFIHVGLDDEQVRRIGDLPTGGGVLGLLIEDPRPVRLTDIAEHPRSAGFPAEHPPMGSFLGVPVRVRERVFGNIYLANKSDGQFTSEDEELLTVLAGTAAVAIEHAQLYVTSQRRQQALTAAADITQELVRSTDHPTALIAERARRVADADLCLVITPMGDRLRVVAAAGDRAGEFRGLVLHGEVDESEPLVEALQPYGLPGGPQTTVAFQAGDGTEGLLLFAREKDGHAFGQTDLDVAQLFADQVGAALGLAVVRRNAELVELLQDRDRIAQELNDQVVSRLFATGLSLNSAVGRIDDEEVRLQLTMEVAALDDIIKHIRTSVFSSDGKTG